MAISDYYPRARRSCPIALADRIRSCRVLNRQLPAIRANPARLNAFAPRLRRRAARSETRTLMVDARLFFGVSKIGVAIIRARQPVRVTCERIRAGTSLSRVVS